MCPHAKGIKKNRPTELQTLDARQEKFIALDFGMVTIWSAWWNGLVVKAGKVPPLRLVFLPAPHPTSYSC